MVSGKRLKVPRSPIGTPTDRGGRHERQPGPHQPRRTRATRRRRAKAPRQASHGPIRTHATCDPQRARQPALRATTPMVEPGSRTPGVIRRAERLQRRGFDACRAVAPHRRRPHSPQAVAQRGGGPVVHRRRQHRRLIGRRRKHDALARAHPRRVAILLFALVLRRAFDVQ